MRYLFVFLLFLNGIFEVMAAELFANSDMHPAEKFLNIRLKLQTLKLYEDIQRLYGKQIKLENISLPNFLGQCDVIEDGVPVVRINSSTIYKEESLVHELYHLRLRKEGFPRYRWKPAPGVWIDLDGLKRLQHELLDPIQHSIFFGEMQKMDVDPFGNAKINCENLLKVSDPPPKDPIGNALVFMASVLETNDNELASRLEQQFKKFNMTDSLKMGKDLLKIINEMKPRTAKEEVETFIKCINALSVGNLSVQIWEWGTEKKGSHVDSTVAILVTPYIK